MLTGTETPTPLRAVLLDAMGVIYEIGDDVGQLLVPFARRQGCTLSEEAIAAAYISASLGKLSAAEFWSELGCRQPAAQLDADYLAGHSLTSGVEEFLRF